MADIDRSYMHLALREAKKGIGRTSPNPCVGAVVVKNNKVVGKGYHKRAGTPHAEIHALREAGKKAKDATLYVTLEPCNHTGRTPPCTEEILRAGISRVVIGMLGLIIVITLVPAFKMNILGAVLIVIFGFLFVTVSFIANFYPSAWDRGKNRQLK